MSLDQPIQIDRLEIYVQASGIVTAEQVSMNRHQFHQRGWAVAGHHASRLTGTIPPRLSGASAPIHFTLTIAFEADGLVRMFVSCRTNGNRAMRRALAARGVQFQASDSDNVIGPSIEHAERIPDLLDEFVRNTCACIRDLIEGLFAGAPEVDTSMSITEIELNRDFVLPSAHLIAHAVQGSSLANSFYVECKRHLDGGRRGEVDRACATTYFYQAKGGGATKFYPKGDDLGRVEFVMDRDAQCHEGIATTGSLDERDLTGMIEAAAQVAAPCLDELEKHVHAVERGTHRPSVLARALAPLLLVEDSALRRGRPSTVSIPEECAKVIDELMIAKRVLLPGVRPGSRLRRALDQLVEVGILVRSTGKFVMYSVAPHLIGAPIGGSA